MNLENFLYQNIEDKKIQNQKNIELNKNLKLKSNLGQEDFLKIFVAQLKAQNPLEPLKDREFVAQMAQFSSLEQMGKLNEKMDYFIKKSGESEYYALLGKKVRCFDAVSKGIHEGKVQSLERKQDGLYLKIEEQLFKVDSVLNVYDN